MERGTHNRKKFERVSPLSTNRKKCNKIWFADTLNTHKKSKNYRRNSKFVLLQGSSELWNTRKECKHYLICTGVTRYFNNGSLFGEVLIMVIIKQINKRIHFISQFTGYYLVELYNLQCTETKKCLIMFIIDDIHWTDIHWS